MDIEKTKEALKRAETELKKMEDKAFNVWFFVIDSKGTPSGSLAYIYETALQLKKLGYNVKMMYAEKDFEGVRGWLGDEYADLPHYNCEEEIAISPSDFLFIPEVYSSVMGKTKNLQCKRVVILQNYGYLTDTMPLGTTWEDMGIYDCVTTTNNLSQTIKEIFRGINVRIVPPSIPSYFTKGDNTDKFVINIVAKNPSDVNAIVKPYQWKYPISKWTSFRDLKNLSRKEFAEALKNSFATVWIDDTTDFGYSAIEAMAAGNIVIGKIPSGEPEWMFNNDGSLANNGLWFYNLKDAHAAISSAVETVLHEAVPEEIKKSMEATVKAYSPERQLAAIKKVYEEDLFENRKKEIIIAINGFKKMIEENK